jgi:hypothetical protein
LESLVAPKIINKFDLPPHFQTVQKVFLKKKPQVRGIYLCLLLFFFSLIVGLLAKSVIIIAISLLPLIVLLFIYKVIKGYIKNPILMEISNCGVYFPHNKTYFPFSSIEKIEKRREVGYAKCLKFEFTMLNVHMQLSQKERLPLWRRKFWLSKSDGQQSYFFRIPFTNETGNVDSSNMLNISNDKIIEIFQSHI